MAGSFDSLTIQRLPQWSAGFFAGARGGTSFRTGNQRFYQTEAFIGLKLPVHWNFYSNWELGTAADASAGWLGDGHVNSFIGTLEPTVELSKGKFPLTLDCGFSPTVLSRHQFGAKNFGDNIQFTSHVGVNWNITQEFTMGLRIQHMSNGGFAEPNPGVNFWLLSVRYNF